MYNNEIQKLQNKIITEVAKEMGLHRELVYKVVKSQWDLLKETIEETDPNKIFTSLKIKQLGIFGVKNNRLRMLEEYQHLYVPKEKIVKHIDPRKQNTN